MHQVAATENRPRGSLLRRPCTCQKDPRFCVVHLAERALMHKQIGQKLWSGMPSHFIKILRCFLGQLKVPHPELFTPKAFRAGKATALAAAGSNLGDILMAGEWKSAAFLAYIDETSVDQAAFLDQTLAESDDEA